MYRFTTVLLIDLFKGTGWLVQELCEKIQTRGMGTCSPISRHQLFIHNDIPIQPGSHKICGEILLNTKSEIIEIGGVGHILFERSKRAKHINISVKLFKGVRVAVPYGVSFDKARQFAQSKRNWIKKHIDKMKQAEKEYETFSINSTEINKAEAVEKLVNRLNELSEQHGFRYNNVFIRSQKTIWGSCSYKNNINLNMKLVRLPDEMIDYVLLHELVHTRIKNHSEAFWTELNKFVENAKKMRKKMNKYKMFLI